MTRWQLISVALACAATWVTGCASVHPLPVPPQSGQSDLEYRQEVEEFHKRASGKSATVTLADGTRLKSLRLDHLPPHRPLPVSPDWGSWVSEDYERYRFSWSEIESITYESHGRGHWMGSWSVR